MAPQELEHASSECLAKWRFLDGGEVVKWGLRLDNVNVTGVVGILHTYDMYIYIYIIKMIYNINKLN